METFSLFETIMAGGLVTTLATQILKLIPTNIFSSRPRLTAGIVSLLSTVVVLDQQGLPVELWLKSGSGISSLLVIVGGVWVLAATAYNNIIRKKDTKPYEY